jgi:hypothetical protein
MKKYSVVSMWKDYCYGQDFFTNILNNYSEYTSIYNDTDFLIIGPFINEETYHLIINKNCIKILYITEPIEINPAYTLCYDLYKNNHFHMIIGCIYNNNNDNNHYHYYNLLKYPLYINCIDDINENIFIKVNDYVKNCSLDKYFCTLINTHDNWGTRVPIYNKLININSIVCPSSLLNNCSNEELNQIGNVEYIKKFLFNICSENTLTNINGYITEKLMNCCLAGAIPIYCGSFDEIDEQIFNKDRILFYDPYCEDSLNHISDIVKELMEDHNKLNDFYKIDVFMESAYNTFQMMNNNLIYKLRNI